MTKCNKIFVLLGGARTFLECFESFCERMLLNLFEDNTKENTYVLLYLKTDDPGPKNQSPTRKGANWNHTYCDVSSQNIHSLIDEMEKKYPSVNFVKHIIPSNEKTDNELFELIPNRKLYYDWLSNDVLLKRALQQSYNYQRCDELIRTIEIQNNIEFDFYIMVRPDIYFIKNFKDISTYYQKANREETKVLGCHDVFFFIPKNMRKGLRIIDFVKNNNSVKIRVSEQIAWATQEQPIYPPPWPRNVDVPTDYFLMKRPESFYMPLTGLPCDTPNEVLVKKQIKENEVIVKNEMKEIKLMTIEDDERFKQEAETERKPEGEQTPKNQQIWNQNFRELNENITNLNQSLFDVNKNIINMNQNLSNLNINISQIKNYQIDAIVNVSNLNMNLNNIVEKVSMLTSTLKHHKLVNMVFTDREKES